MCYGNPPLNGGVRKTHDTTKHNLPPPKQTKNKKNTRTNNVRTTKTGDVVASAKLASARHFALRAEEAFVLLQPFGIFVAHVLARSRLTPKGVPHRRFGAGRRRVWLLSTGEAKMVATQTGYLFCWWRCHCHCMTTNNTRIVVLVLVLVLVSLSGGRRDDCQVARMVGASTDVFRAGHASVELRDETFVLCKIRNVHETLHVTAADWTGASRTSEAAADTGIGRIDCRFHVVSPAALAEAVATRKLGWECPAC